MSGDRIRVTVCWHPDAEAELAELWLASSNAELLKRAANELDSLLQVNPATKGRPHALTKLNEAQTRALLSRTSILPEDLRYATCGPLTVFFTPHEEDRQSRIWMVELKSSQ